MPAGPSTAHRGLVARLPLAVGVLAALLASARVRADDRGVSVACPELDREGAAEIESRARAALLISDLGASITIVCETEGVRVTAQSVNDAASVRLAPTSATFRDEVLAAVEATLDQLRAPPTARAPAPESDPTATAPPASTPPTPEAKLVPAPPPPPLAPKPAPPQPSDAADYELFGALGFEVWSEHLAGTAALGARRGGRAARFGVRGAVARRLVQDESFSATELSATLEADLALGFASGVHLALDAGPSLLVVTPSADVSAFGNLTKAALVLGAELSRPLWLGRMAVLPALGVRWFSSERGVKLDSSERFVLSGFQPRVTLGLLYRLE